MVQRDKEAQKDPWPQSSPYGISVWAVVVGAFVIVLMIAFYYIHGKKNGIDLKAQGVLMPIRKLCKTILPACGDPPDRYRHLA